MTGLVPWEGKSIKAIYKAVCLKDKRPELPADCNVPEFLKEVMEQCWLPKPADRPTFAQLLDRFAAVADNPEFAPAPPMEDDRVVHDVPGYTILDFGSSNFRREYELHCRHRDIQPHEKDRLLFAVRRLIEGYCTRNNINQSQGRTFLRELQAEWQLTDNVDVAAERVWTSTQKLDHGDGAGLETEFCSLFSQAIREDRASLARPCVIVARALRGNLIAARTSSAGVDFPSNGECWRGGGFKEEHRGFFTVGKKYRIPAFLPTSLKKSVTNTFMFKAETAGYPVVQWKIELDIRGDPQGQNMPQYLCKHVNLLRVTHAPGEEEYLFQAFSVFTVKEAIWSDNPDMQHPHQVTLTATVDNTAESEALPLAPWY
jgi:hypothetical protein